MMEKTLRIMVEKMTLLVLKKRVIMIMEKKMRQTLVNLALNHKTLKIKRLMR
jgi:hypothetical protein